MDIVDKIDAVTKIGKNRIEMGGIQPPPKSVKIEITARCNLRCKFCALHTRETQPKQDMDFDFFKAITTDMRYSGVEEIGLFYLGESFMAPDLLIECTKWCKRELGFPWVFLTSNGTNAKPFTVLEVMSAGLDSLKWSVNHESPEQFKEITGGSERLFRQVLTNIKQAFEIRNRKKLDTILSASSILYAGDQKDRMEKLLKTHVIPYVDSHYWLPLFHMSMYSERIEKEMGYRPTAGNTGRIDENTMKPNRQPIPCWSAFTEGHVRVDGGLSACCFGSDEKFDMGMLDGKNFMSQWNSSRFQELREAQLDCLNGDTKAIAKTVCRECVAYDL